MNKLKVNDSMNDSEVTFTEKIAKGIYQVSESGVVLRNCETLRINIDAPTSRNKIVEKVRMIGELGILTMRIAESYVPYIFTNDADPTAFELLIREVPPDNHDAFRRAYNATKL